MIGSAGSDEKVKLLVEEYGFDAAFNYKNGPVAEQLAQAAPEGIDVFFDNVGGEHLEAAIGALNIHARIVLSGMVSQYNDEKVVGPRNLWNLSVTRSKMLAFMVTEELDLQPDFIREVGGWAATGKLRFRETDLHRSDYHEMSHPMSQSSTIRLERTTPQTAKITFANPPANLVVSETVVTLHDIVRNLDKDPDIQVVVFASEVPDFFINHFDGAEAGNLPAAVRQS